jgi:hypothetical protein
MEDNANYKPFLKAISGADYCRLWKLTSRSRTSEMKELAWAAGAAWALNLISAIRERKQ